jgi:anti-sigma B factor antagonist
MTITPSVAGGALFLRVAGRLDSLTSPDFAAQCQELIGANQQKVVLNVEGVEYVSSAGLRAILVLGKAAQNRGGVLALCGVKGTVKTVMELAGFPNLFPIYDSPEAALESR